MRAYATAFSVESAEKQFKDFNFNLAVPHRLDYPDGNKTRKQTTAAHSARFCLAKNSARITRGGRQQHQRTIPKAGEGFLITRRVTPRQRRKD
jgi:hypothetical protein